MPRKTITRPAAVAALTAALGLLAASGASAAKNPCAPVGGASPCTYQLQLGESLDQPVDVGQVVQVQSVDPVNLTFAGLGTVSCQVVTFGGSVQGIAPAGLLTVGLDSASFGLESDECGSTGGPVILRILGPQKWVNVLNAAKGKGSLVSDGEETKMIIYFSVTWKRLPGGNELTCTFKASKINSSFNADGQPIQLDSKTTKLSLDKSASDRSCPRTGSLASSSWSLEGQTPAGGLAPIVAAQA